MSRMRKVFAAGAILMLVGVAACEDQGPPPPPDYDWGPLPEELVDHELADTAEYVLHRRY